MAALKLRVNAVAREGFTDRRRAGLAVPRGSGKFLEVLVVDDAKDPEGRLLNGHLAIGQETLAVLKSDPDIFIDSGDGADAAKENAELRKLVAELQAANEEHKAQAAALVKENAELKAKLAQKAQK